MGLMAQPTLQDIVELSGEAVAEDIKQLTLRGQSIASFEPYAGSLPALECLSLSHNTLTDLAGFLSLHNLVTVNLNNNSLTSLDGLQSCYALQQLYAANNHIRDLQPLATLTQLHTLNCMKNSISSLNECLQVLANLVHLSDLDLSMNPVAAVPSCKEMLIDCIPSLCLLDGERLMESHRKHSGSPRMLTPPAQNEGGLLAGGLISKNVDILTLESEASSSKSTGLIGAALDVSTADDAQPQSSQPSLPTRPSTACLTPHGSGSLLPGGPGTRSAHSMARPGTPSGYTHQLLSDPGLNDHPLVLQYLATHVLCEALTVTGPKAGAALASKGRSSFATRLRTAASVMSSAEGLQVEQLLDKQTIKAALPEASNSIEAAKALLDGASPNEVIRQLVRLAEVLIREVELLKRSPSSAGLQTRPSVSSAASSSAPGSRPNSSSTTTIGAAGAASVPKAQEGRKQSPGAAGRLQCSSSSTLLGVSSPAGVSKVDAPGDGNVAGPVAAAPITAQQDTRQTGDVAVVDSAQPQLQEEVTRLRREVKQLQLENANVYWLADEVKRLKAQLAQAQASSS